MRKEYELITSITTHRFMGLINAHGLVDFIYSYVQEDNIIIACMNIVGANN